MTKNFISLAILVAAWTGSAPAQPTSAQGKLPLAIVLVDDLPFPNAKAVVVRRKDMKPQNLVLVTRQTSPDDLTRAMGALFSSRSHKGDQISSDLAAPVPPGILAKHTRDYPQAVKDLTELRSARPRFIEGVGTRPVIYSHLRPAPARAGKG